MKGLLIGNRTGQVIEEWQGTLEELIQRFDFEGKGYHLEVFPDDGGESIGTWEI